MNQKVMRLAESESRLIAMKHDIFELLTCKKVHAKKSEGNSPPSLLAKDDIYKGGLIRGEMSGRSQRRATLAQLNGRSIKKIRITGQR